VRQFDFEGRKMEARNNSGMIDRIRRFLPVIAYARPRLLASIRKLEPNPQSGHPLKVTSIFYAGEEHGIMCRLELSGDAYPAAVFVVPLSYVHFDRLHPISREITAFRKRQPDLKRSDAQGAIIERGARRNAPAPTLMRSPPVVLP
jgi:hypothetical protein